MKRIAILTTAALLAFSSLGTTNADAQWRRYRSGGGGAVAAGLIGGLALGAIAASASRSYYGRSYGDYYGGYYPNGGYIPGGGYAPEAGYYESYPVYYAPTYYAPPYQTVIYGGAPLYGRRYYRGW